MGVGSLRKVNPVHERQSPTWRVNGNRLWHYTKGDLFSDVCDCTFRKDNKVKSFFAPQSTCHFVLIAWC